MFFKANKFSMPFKRKSWCGQSCCFVIWIFLLNIYFTHSMPTDKSPTKGPICHFFLNSSVVDIQDTHRDGDIIYDNNTVQCNSPTDHCFNIMKLQQNNASNENDPNNVVLLYSGCFREAAQCKTDKCTGTLHKSQIELRFCCCEGDYCNRLDNIEMIREVESSTPLDEKDPQKLTVLTIRSVVVLIVTAAIVVLCAVYCQYRRRKLHHDDKSPDECAPLQAPSIDLEHISFGQLIGTGRYGRVYRAKLHGESVAVKVLDYSQKQLFTDEKYIYSLPLMEHPNLLTYFGAGEVLSTEIGSGLGIVLSLCDGTKLSSLLSTKTLSFSEFCNVVISATRGLAHLHSIIIKGDFVKPCVAHRDLNTRNILVKSDMTCVICDMGFAIHTRGARFYVNGEERVAEMASLTDVGTIRYMAPEVLEGAVNLRDCETSLKQIDVYALGLVLWEVAYRCRDLYQGTEPPDHQLPFQKEIGLQPSFEQMQVLVARNKARPLFPTIWKDSNAAILQLKETIEDCWDTDADARLSASCVEKRLSELEKIWCRYKASIPVPSVNPAPNSGVLNQVRTVEDSNRVITNQLIEGTVGSSDSVSETTMESIVPNSPSDNIPNIVKNESTNVMALLPALQPHQGTNPCLERNMVNEVPVQHIRSGNTWMEPSQQTQEPFDISDFHRSALMEVLEKQNDVTPRMLTSEHLVPLLNGYRSETRNTSCPVEYHQPPIPPISYLQNQVSKPDAVPKVINSNRQNKVKPKKWRNIRNNWGERLSSIF